MFTRKKILIASSLTGSLLLASGLIIANTASFEPQADDQQAGQDDAPLLEGSGRHPLADLVGKEFKVEGFVNVPEGGLLMEKTDPKYKDYIPAPRLDTDYFIYGISGSFEQTDTQTFSNIDKIGIDVKAMVHFTGDESSFGKIRDDFSRLAFIAEAGGGEIPKDDHWFINVSKIIDQSDGQLIFTEPRLGHLGPIREQDRRQNSYAYMLPPGTPYPQVSRAIFEIWLDKGEGEPVLKLRTDESLIYFRMYHPAKSGTDVVFPAEMQ